MFEEKYSKEKIRLFLRYLANAVIKLEKNATIQELKQIPVENKIIRFSEREKIIEKKVMERLSEITPERKEEIELKIKAFYSKNKYLPFEMKIKKIKEKISKMKKSDKKKANDLKEKLKKCENFLKTLKKVDMAKLPKYP